MPSSGWLTASPRLKGFPFRRAPSSSGTRTSPPTGTPHTPVYRHGNHGSTDDGSKLHGLGRIAGEVPSPCRWGDGIESPRENSSRIPNGIPNAVPNGFPNGLPNAVPSEIPNEMPLSDPNAVPSALPSSVPSEVLSEIPNGIPSEIPSEIPSAIPHGIPDGIPSEETASDSRAGKPAVLLKTRNSSLARPLDLTPLGHILLKHGNARARRRQTAG